MTENKTFAGIDIGGTNIKYGLFDSRGKIIFRSQRPTLAEKGPAPLLHLITNIAEDLLRSASEDDLIVNYLGVGTPGAVDSRTGTVIGPCPNIKGWMGTEIGRTLNEHLNIPVYVENDANAVALAESRLGSAKGSSSVVCVTVGTGIGGGIILDGKIWRGNNFSAAELGHISIDLEGPVCGCGNKGCIEAYCSSRAILGRTRERLATGLTPAFEAVLDGDIERLSIRKLFAALRRHDQVAEEIIDETSKLLGFGLAGVVNLLNPETLVIGGGVADGGGGFVDKVAAEIRKLAFASAVEHLKIVRATLGNDAGFIGAGLLGDNPA